MHVNNGMEELPVLSPSVAETGEDDRVDQEQTAQKEWRQVRHVLLQSVSPGASQQSQSYQSGAWLGARGRGGQA